MVSYEFVILRGRAAGFPLKGTDDFHDDKTIRAIQFGCRSGLRHRNDLLPGFHGRCHFTASRRPVCIQRAIILARRNLSHTHGVDDLSRGTLRLS